MAGQLATVRQLICAAFIAAWTPGAGTFCLANEAFDPPVGATWARVSVQHVDSLQESLGKVGTRRFNRKALLFVQLFAPLDSGLNDLDTKAQIVRTTFEGTRIQSAGEDIRINAVDVAEIGPTDDGWYQMNVSAPVDYTEIR